MSYKEVETQREYRELLTAVLEETQLLINDLQSVVLYKVIFKEVSDINELIAKKKKLSEEQIYKRYTIGSIAVKNFDSENDLYSLKLQDIFGGLFEYYDLPKS